jgi:hypothetical protein
VVQVRDWKKSMPVGWGYGQDGNIPLGGGERSWVGPEVGMQEMQWTDQRFGRRDLLGH